MLIVTAADQATATKVVKLANPYLLHMPLPGMDHLPSFAFLSSPAEIPRGPLYEFLLQHVVAADVAGDLSRTEITEVGRPDDHRDPPSATSPTSCAPRTPGRSGRRSTSSSTTTPPTTPWPRRPALDPAIIGALYRVDPATVRIFRLPVDPGGEDLVPPPGDPGRRGRPRHARRPAARAPRPPPARRHRAVTTVVVTAALPAGGTDPLLAAGLDVVQLGDRSHAALRGGGGHAPTPWSSSSPTASTPPCSTPAQRPAAGRGQRGRRLRQHRRRPRRRARASRSCNTPGRARRDHRRAGLRPGAHGPAPHHRRRAHAAAGRWDGWAINGFLGHDLAGATMGIVGWGQIGRALGRRADGVRHGGASTRAADRPASPATSPTLDELLAGADVVSLHVPLTADDPPPHRRRRSSPSMEPTARAGEHVPGTGRRRGRPGRRPARRHDLRRRHRRLRGRARGAPPPARRTRRRAAPPHRQRHRRHPHRHGPRRRPPPSSTSSPAARRGRHHPRHPDPPRSPVR